MTHPRLKPVPAVREMRLSDVDAVSRLANRIWHTHYPAIISLAQIEYMTERLSSPQALTQLLKDGKQRFWLLYDGNDLAGYAALEAQENDTWYIDKLYIDTDRHRAGLGSYFLSALQKLLRPKALTLRVNRKNYQAINFYFKHGFTIDRILDTDIGGGFAMEDFVMRWTA